MQMMNNTKTDTNTPAAAVLLPDDADRLLTRAIRAHCRREGASFPSAASAIEEHKGRHYAVLRNVNGVIAVYRVLPGGQIRALRTGGYVARRFQARELGGSGARA